ncbi:MAG TPA: hypothetical protein VFZ51_03910 [Woeseiaceae bacterium]
MSGQSTRDTDIHDLSLSVIHALAMVDVRVLSYIQLRRLYAALTHARDDVEQETLRRTDDDVYGDVVNVPRLDPPRTK